ncbi:hypothetical protein G6O69_02450 [Pseudenhygromyxa sp. WMMC2535]|uniref:hypothetical protein n=1 Tax=Pseudenhygromyxa sp. WMMC2535 TaxID=2712867 RepID=UPI001595AAE9|nr:hypothetical protein [Pseudenhygromyxa sp. WMMC2535]NVB36675.1 hypothetical protein [Pseudenhygromyxa sp. WMMC2535]
MLAWSMRPSTATASSSKASSSSKRPVRGPLLTLAAQLLHGSVTGLDALLLHLCDGELLDVVADLHGRRRTQPADVEHDDRQDDRRKEALLEPPAQKLRSR